MKKITNEFKTFIRRGNVVDMAVGIIVGSSFTAIVNSISNQILKPLVNWLLSMAFDADSLSEIYTFLKKVYVEDEGGNPTEEVNLAASIYIDWGAFLNAVLSFFLIALVLFSIVKIINRIRAEHREFSRKIADSILDRDERNELRAAGISLRDRAAIRAYFTEKEQKQKKLLEEKKQLEKEKKEKERLENPSTEELLKQILQELQKKS